MHLCNIPARLESINGVPHYCHAPRDVFPEQSMNFNDFKEILRTHFNQEDAAPIMLDDATYALNIIGFGQKGAETILWIADPHVKAGVNSVPSQYPYGLYTITLDEDGQQIDHSLTKEDEENMFSSSSYKGLHFDTKEWMVLIPE